MLEVLARRLLPERILEIVRNYSRNRAKRRLAVLPALSEASLKNLLLKDLKIQPGNVVFVHSSINNLNLSFPFYKVLSILLEVVGKDGTLLFPTFPKIPAYDEYAYLKSGVVFDVRETPANTGILSEYARRQKEARRSFHPTKSVCALGPLAQELTGSHQNSVYPFDTCSPFYKIMEHQGVIIGLGVPTAYLSFIHCVDDALKDRFPVNPYHDEILEAKCINYDGKMETVKTYAHDYRKVSQHSLPRFIKGNIPSDICQDFTLSGRKFFRADAARLFDRMKDLAERNKTFYSILSYKWKH